MHWVRQKYFSPRTCPLPDKRGQGPGPEGQSPAQAGQERGARTQARALAARSARRGGRVCVSEHALAEFKCRGTFCDYTFPLSCLMAPPVTPDTSIQLCILYHR